MLDKVRNGVYRDIEWEEFRDPLATRLLDFILLSRLERHGIGIS